MTMTALTRMSACCYRIAFTPSAVLLASTSRCTQSIRVGLTRGLPGNKSQSQFRPNRFDSARKPDYGGGDFLFCRSYSQRTGKAAQPSKINAATRISSSETREILVQHLLLQDDDLPLLLELQKRIIQEGLDLGDLAAEFSICPSKVDGGMVGWIGRGRTVPEFEEAAFNSPLEKIVRVKTKHGWHLLQVLAEREAAVLEQISPQDFARSLEDAVEGAVQLIDVREPDEIQRAAVPGFKAYPLSQFGQWAPTITDELDTEKDTYVMCHHGVRSQQAAEWLKSQGFKRLHNIAGGIDAYSLQVDESIPRY